MEGVTFIYYLKSCHWDFNSKYLDPHEERDLGKM
jgi:hypothetical protein